MSEDAAKNVAGTEDEELQEAQGIRKAAIAVMALGPKLAGEIFGLLTPEDVEGLLDSAEAIHDVQAGEVLAALKDLNRQVGQQVAGVSGHEQMLRDAAVTAFGNEGLQALLGRDASGAAGQLRAAAASDPEAFARAISREHPQVATVVLTLLPVETSAIVLRTLPKELKSQVVRRVATIRSIPASVITEVAEIVSREMQRPAEAGPIQIDGTEVAVGLLKGVGLEDEASIFEDLEGQDAELAEYLKSLMFVFEDIIKLHPREVQLILREVDSQQLAIAMKGISSELKEFILSNMSSRAAMIVLDELEALGPMSPAQVDQAQTDVITIIMRLSDDGKVNLRPGDSL